MNPLKASILMLAVVGFVLTGCDSGQMSDNGNGDSTGDLPPWEQYENQLQRGLFDAATSGDARGVQDSLEIHQMIQVEIQMDADGELPTGYLIFEEARAPLGGTLTVQAFVRVDQLLELSQEPSINYIRAPARPRR